MTFCLSLLLSSHVRPFFLLFFFSFTSLWSLASSRWHKLPNSYSKILILQLETKRPLPVCNKLSYEIHKALSKKRDFFYFMFYVCYLELHTTWKVLPGIVYTELSIQICQHSPVLSSFMENGPFLSW